MYYRLGNTDILMYDLVGFLGILVFFIYDYSQKKRKKHLISGVSRLIYLKTHKKIAGKEYPYLNLEIFIIALIPVISIDLFTENLGMALNLGRESMLFFICIPYLYVLIFWIMKINPLKQMDLVALGFPLAYMVMKFSCFCAGCCGSSKLAGVLALYNQHYDCYEFPLQIVESLLYGASFLVLNKFKSSIKVGNLLPSYLLIHGFIRFITQFFKNRKSIIGPFTDYHFVAVFLMLSAVAQMVFLHFYRSKINAYFDEIDERITNLEKEIVDAHQ